jgi:hypothetical protein
MKSNKIVFIILILLAVVFAAGIGSQFLTGSTQEEDELSEDEAIAQAKKLVNDWVGSLARSLDFLSPSFDRKRLQANTSCLKGQKTFQLTNDTACLVDISPKKDALWNWTDFEKLVLKPEGTTISLQSCRCEKTSTSERGAGFLVNRKKILKLPNRLNLPIHVDPAVFVQSHPQLEVSYFPHGETVVSQCSLGETLVCEDVEAVKIIVLNEGGTLLLACDGCSETDPATISLE